MSTQGILRCMFRNPSALVAARRYCPREGAGPEYRDRNTGAYGDVYGSGPQVPCRVPDHTPFYLVRYHDVETPPRPSSAGRDARGMREFGRHFSGGFGAGRRGPGGRPRDGVEKRRRLRGLGISARTARSRNLHGDAGVRPRGAGSPPGTERGNHLQAARGDVPRRSSPAGRQTAGHRLFRPQRRRDMVLALSRVESPQHGALRPVRPTHGHAEEDFAFPNRYERRQAPLKPSPNTPSQAHSFTSVMPPALRGATLLALAGLAAGCANFSAISPGDSAHSVEARVGPPAAVWKNADGSEVWEYPQGPASVQTFMITIDSDLAVREMHQVLSEEYFSKVHAGMSRDEVRRLLGRPKEIWYFSRRDEDVWVWRYLEVNYRFFNVLFDHTSGMVRTTLRLMTRP